MLQVSQFRFCVPLGAKVALSVDSMSAVFEPFDTDIDELKCDDSLTAPNVGSGSGDGLSGGGPSADSTRGANRPLSWQKEEASELAVVPQRRGSFKSAVVEPFDTDIDELKCDDSLTAPNVGSGDGDGLSGGGPSADSTRAAYQPLSRQKEEASELDVVPQRRGSLDKHEHRGSRRGSLNKLQTTVRNVGSLQVQHEQAKVGRTRVIRIHGAMVGYSANDAGNADGGDASSAGGVSAADVAKVKALAAAVLGAAGDGTASGGAQPSALKQKQLKGLLQSHARASAQGIAAARSIAESGGVGFEEHTARAKLHTPAGWMLSPVQRMPWDFFLVTLLVYIMIALPYRLCFDHEARGAMAIVELSIDCCFLIDVRALGDARSRATAAAAAVVCLVFLSRKLSAARACRPHASLLA